ncbi:hypothetical protein HDU82_001504, partial [Entophlyctis luteolus]
MHQLKAGEYGGALPEPPEQRMRCVRRRSLWVAVGTLLAVIIVFAIVAAHNILDSDAGSLGTSAEALLLVANATGSAMSVSANVINGTSLESAAAVETAIETVSTKGGTTLEKTPSLSVAMTQETTMQEKTTHERTPEATSLSTAANNIPTMQPQHGSEHFDHSMGAPEI